MVENLQRGVGVMAKCQHNALSNGDMVNVVKGAKESLWC